MKEDTFCPEGTPPVAVLVLGMHRSGTSALTGLLAILGCALPRRLIGGNISNEKGYFESIPLNDFHEELLGAAGSRWDDWLAFPFERLTDTEAYRDRAEAILEAEYANSRLFVLKDPRMCRLMPFWADILSQRGIEPYYIHPHRHPLEVAASLHRRDGMDRDLAFLIWLRHVLDAEAASRGGRRVFTSYDQLIDDWREVAAAVRDTLGLPLGEPDQEMAKGIEKFLAPDLNHYRDVTGTGLQDPSMPDWVRRAHAIFERWAQDGENADDYPVLDAIREALTDAASTFSGLVNASRDRAAKLLRLAMEAAREQDPARSTTHCTKTPRAAAPGAP